MFYGGAGYGSHERPDLSNTSFLVDALHELGNGEDDEAIQKALAFVSRCQNFESPQNNSKNAARINDGGFYYTVANGGESKAGSEPVPQREADSHSARKPERWLSGASRAASRPRKPSRASPAPTST